MGNDIETGRLVRAEGRCVMRTWYNQRITFWQGQWVVRTSVIRHDLPYCSYGLCVGKSWGKRLLSVLLSASTGLAYISSLDLFVQFNHFSFIINH